MTFGALVDKECKNCNRRFDIHPPAEIERGMAEWLDHSSVGLLNLDSGHPRDWAEQGFWLGVAWALREHGVIRA